MPLKIVLKINQKSVKNRSKNGPKIDWFWNVFGDGFDLGSILEPFSDTKSVQILIDEGLKIDAEKVSKKRAPARAGSAGDSGVGGPK